MRMRCFPFAAVMMGLGLIVGLGPCLDPGAHAASVSWTGSVGDNLWSTPANWSTGQIPGAGDDVTVDGAGGSITVFLRGSRSVRSLVNSGTIVVQGIAPGGNAVLTAGVGVTNAGTILLGSSGLGYNAQISLTTNAALVNQAQGTRGNPGRRRRRANSDRTIR